MAVGCGVGVLVGCVVGDIVGSIVGVDAGEAVGITVMVGVNAGVALGDAVASGSGVLVGMTVGRIVGVGVGCVPEMIRMPLYVRGCIAVVSDMEKTPLRKSTGNCPVGASEAMFSVKSTSVPLSENVSLFEEASILQWFSERL